MSQIAIDISTLAGANTADAEKYIILNAAAKPASDDGSTHIFYVDRRFWLQNSIQLILSAAVGCGIWRSADTVNWVEIGTSISTSGITDLPEASYGYLGVSRDQTTVGTVTAILTSSKYING